MRINLEQEKKLWKKGYSKVFGLDESGRGSLAGPVVAAAVFLKQNERVQLKKLNLVLRDSKKITSKKRKQIYRKIKENPGVEYKIAKVFQNTIDKINIKAAAELAMLRALRKFNKSNPIFLLIDGKFLGNKKLKQNNHKLIIRGDEKIFSCVVAGIVAKIERDKTMIRYHKKHPEYNFNKHKGYGTKLHRKMIKKYNPCFIHRKSFKLI